MTREEAVTRLQLAAEAKRQAEQDATAAFTAAVVEALRAGVKPAEAAKATGYSYETIRRIAREHGIERLREPTVTSRKRKT